MNEVYTLRVCNIAVFWLLFCHIPNKQKFIIQIDENSFLIFYFILLIYFFILILGYWRYCFFYIVCLKFERQFRFFEHEFEMWMACSNDDISSVSSLMKLLPFDNTHSVQFVSFVHTCSVDCICASRIITVKVLKWNRQAVLYILFHLSTRADRETENKCCVNLQNASISQFIANQMHTLIRFKSIWIYAIRVIFGFFSVSNLFLDIPRKVMYHYFESVFIVYTLCNQIIGLNSRTSILWKLNDKSGKIDSYSDSHQHVSTFKPDKVMNSLWYLCGCLIGWFIQIESHISVH